MSNTNSNLPTPAINAATYYDVGTQQLNLFITYPSGFSLWPKGIVVDLITPPSTSPTRIGNGAPVFPANSNTGTLVMPLALTSASQQGQLTVASLDTSWETGAPSDPWQFPAITSSPLTSPATASFNSLGSVEVTWTWKAGMGATGQQVALIIPGEQPITTIVESPDVTATFTMAEANNMFSPGLTVTIQCAAISSGLWAAPVTTTFTIPQSSQMTPYSIKGAPPISPYCTMTSLPVHGTSNLEVWWGTAEGAVETTWFPDTGPSGFAGASTISNTGSCLASIYITPTNQQVWWITETGAIDGKVYSANGWASPGTGAGEAIPFNVAGTASTTNGGSMTGLVLEGNTGAILFWVDPYGAIAYCRWLASSGWQTVNGALPPGTASPATQLSVLSVSSSVYLFCVSLGSLYWNKLTAINLNYK